jgi:hypothetical protein
MKMFGLGFFSYFETGWNRFDCFMVLSSSASVVLGAFSQRIAHAFGTGSWYNVPPLTAPVAVSTRCQHGPAKSACVTLIQALSFDG